MLFRAAAVPEREGRIIFLPSCARMALHKSVLLFRLNWSSEIVMAYAFSRLRVGHFKFEFDVALCLVQACSLHMQFW